MYENEPAPRFKLDFSDGTELICTRETASVFLHVHEPHGDHIYIVDSVDPEDEPSGNYVFRDQLDNFDQITDSMYEAGYYVNSCMKMTEHDRGTFNEYYATKHPLKYEPLTPRQERLVHFVAYILLSEQLNANDFNASGELFI